jgi:hypothetical protein
MEGHKFMFDEKLVTVWSAPNYCYRLVLPIRKPNSIRCGNVASIMTIDGSKREFKTFDAVPDTDRKIPPKQPLPYFL